MGILLAQNIVEIVTIVAVILIGIIFAIYLIVLKKNGWLGENSNFYRCPNQECKKIFKKPIELKDLSESPPRIYPACPECGADLRNFFGSRTENVLKMRNQYLSHAKKPEIKSIKKTADNKKIETQNQQKNQPSILEEKVPIAKPITDIKKPEATDHPECKYYFGYLASREKDDEIPDTCLGCPKSLECMLSNLKTKNSVNEIEKWYQVKA